MLVAGGPANAQSGIDAKAPAAGAVRQCGILGRILLTHAGSPLMFKWSGAVATLRRPLGESYRCPSMHLMPPSQARASW